MKKMTIMVIPDGVSATRHIHCPQILVRVLLLVGLIAGSGFGYLAFDYIELKSLRIDYKQILAENEGLRGEARMLLGNLNNVKSSLRRVKDYAAKLGDITQIHVKKVKRQVGIGPLTDEEFQNVDVELANANHYIPSGIDIDKLSFKTVFDDLNSINGAAKEREIELRKLLSTLTQQSSLLSAIPATKPVKGWITSNFGQRVSPFTGKHSRHMGIDVAASVGVPIYAPADGVVVFSGKKVGFGNFMIIAHGHGMVTSYGHNHQNLAQVGQMVSRGEQIGTVGMTGRTTGPHLHYEVQHNGKHMDPRRFILDDDALHFY